EGAAHGAGAAEAGGPGDLFEAPVGSLEAAARGFDARPEDVAGRRRPDLPGEDALEVADAHRHPAGEVLDRKPLLQVLRDPDLELANRGHLGGLRREPDAQLRLAPRPAPGEPHT